jgi:hypothetical protein
LVVEERAPVETEPLVAPPVENPVPVQEVLLVEDQERVEEPPLVTEDGAAFKVAVGVAAFTVMAVHPSQLFPSLLSVFVPAHEVLLSAQARYEYEPAEAKV